MPIVAASWIESWVLSLVISGGVFGILRSQRVAITDALAITFALSVLPITVIYSGANSLLYPVDLACPGLAALAVQRWRRSPREIVLAATVLTIVVGAVPLANTLVANGDRIDVLANVANLYRCIEVSALLIALSAADLESDRMIESAMWAGAWVVVCIGVAAGLQLAGVLNLNVFYELRAQHLPEVQRVAVLRQYRYAVGGLFRGSMGIIGVIGLALGGALIDRPSRRLTKYLAVGVGASGIWLIVAAESKTAIVAAAAFTIVYTIGRWYHASRRAKFLRLGIYTWILGAAIVGIAFYGRRGMQLLMVMLNTNAQQLQSLTYRTNRWGLLIKALSQSPEILAGWIKGTGVPLRSGFFHNEYLAVLFLGGLGALMGYIWALWTVGKHLYRVWRRGSKGSSAAFPLFVSSLIQGVTVAHFRPGLFFIGAVSFTVTVYALAIGRERAISGSRSATAGIG